MRYYDLLTPSEISDKYIKEEFEMTSMVDLSARGFSRLQYIRMSFGSLLCWLPITRVLPIVGITPQIMRQVFFNKNLPEVIETFDELGNLPMSAEAFKKFSQILKKSLRVFIEDVWTGGHNLVFTVYHTSGEVIPS